MGLMWVKQWGIFLVMEGLLLFTLVNLLYGKHINQFANWRTERLLEKMAWSCPRCRHDIRESYLGHGNFCKNRGCLCTGTNRFSHGS